MHDYYLHKSSAINLKLYSLECFFEIRSWKIVSIAGIDTTTLDLKSHTGAHDLSVTAISWHTDSRGSAWSFITTKILWGTTREKATKRCEKSRWITWNSKTMRSNFNFAGGVEWDSGIKHWHVLSIKINSRICRKYICHEVRKGGIFNLYYEDKSHRKLPEA